MAAARILVVGHQRSGTSWVGNVLQSTASAHYLSEPDDPTHVPFATRAYAGRGGFPLLRAGDAGWADLIRLWDAAYGVEPVRAPKGRHWASTRLYESVPLDERDRALSPEARVPWRLRVAGALAVPRHARFHAAGYQPHRIMKSVYGSCMVEWIASRWDATVVVCLRHPLEVVASFLEVGLLRGAGTELLARMGPAARAYGRDVYRVPEPVDHNPVAVVAWRVGFVMSWLDDARRAHPEYHVIDHDAVCVDPVGRFRALVDSIGLEWTSETEAFILASDAPGSGYQIRRVASEQRDRWLTRLSADDARVASRVLAQFPIAARYADDLV